MGGKRTAHPSENAHGGKAAADGDGVSSQGPSWKRQTLELTNGAAAGSVGAGSSGHDDSGSMFSPVTMCLSMRCDQSDVAGRKAALEAALMKVMTEFGGRECRVDWTRVGPSEDTLQRVLPLLLGHVAPKGAGQLLSVCKAWEPEARNFFKKMEQLCSVRTVCTLPGHSDSVSEVAFSPDGTRIATGSGDNLVKIWNAATGAGVSEHSCAS